jgi:hypothetical protein
MGLNNEREFVAAGPVSRILSAGKLPFRGPRTAGRPFLWAAHYCAALATYPKVLTRRAGTRPPPPRILGTKNSQRRRNSLPIWSCSVWGLPCPPDYSDGGALLPHLFTLTPHPAIGPAKAVYFLWHFPSTGLHAGFPDVIRHTALRSSDFPPSSLDATRAAVRSSCLPIDYIR